MKYKSADTSTLKGLRYAEWLHAHGWKAYSVGLFIIRFSKKKEKRHGKKS